MNTQDMNVFVHITDNQGTVPGIEGPTLEAVDTLIENKSPKAFTDKYAKAISSSSLASDAVPLKFNSASLDTIDFQAQAIEAIIPQLTGKAKIFAENLMGQISAAIGDAVASAFEHGASGGKLGAASSDAITRMIEQYYTGAADVEMGLTGNMTNISKMNSLPKRGTSGGFIRGEEYILKSKAFEAYRAAAESIASNYEGKGNFQREYEEGAMEKPEEGTVGTTIKTDEAFKAKIERKTKQRDNQKKFETQKYPNLGKGTPNNTAASVSDIQRKMIGIARIADSEAFQGGGKLFPNAISSGDARQLALGLAGTETPEKGVAIRKAMGIDEFKGDKSDIEAYNKYMAGVEAQVEAATEFWSEAELMKSSGAGGFLSKYLYTKKKGGKRLKSQAREGLDDKIDPTEAADALSEAEIEAIQATNPHYENSPMFKEEDAAALTREAELLVKGIRGAEGFKGTGKALISGALKKQIKADKAATEAPLSTSTATQEEIDRIASTTERLKPFTPSASMNSQELYERNMRKKAQAQAQARTEDKKKIPEYGESINPTQEFDAPPYEYLRYQEKQYPGGNGKIYKGPAYGFDTPFEGKFNADIATDYARGSAGEKASITKNFNKVFASLSQGEQAWAIADLQRLQGAIQSSDTPQMKERSAFIDKTLKNLTTGDNANKYAEAIKQAQSMSWSQEEERWYSGNQPWNNPMNPQSAIGQTTQQQAPQKSQSQTTSKASTTSSADTITTTQPIEVAQPVQGGDLSSALAGEGQGIAGVNKILIEHNDLLTEAIRLEGQKASTAQRLQGVLGNIGAGDLSNKGKKDEKSKSKDTRTTSEEPIDSTKESKKEAEKEAGETSKKKSGEPSPSSNQQLYKDIISSQKLMKQAELDMIKAEAQYKNKNLSADQKAAALSKYEETQGIYMQAAKEHGQLFGKKDALDPQQQKQLLAEMDKVNQKYGVLNKQAQIETFQQKSFFQQLGMGFKQSLRNLMDYQLAYQIIGKIRQAFQQVIQTAKQLDAALTNMQIVTNGTKQSTRELMRSFYDLADSLGKTAEEASKAATDWLRAGYRGADINKLIESSLTLSTLGMIDSAQATKYLTSQIKGWKMSVEDTMTVVDKLTALDANAAISAGDLAEAMSRANVSAQMGGSDWDRYAAYITTVADTTQKSVSSIGEGFKTLYARYGNVKLGKWNPKEEDIGGEDFNEENFKSLNDIETALSKAGIHYRKGTKDLRDFDEVMDEIGSKWNTMDKITQNAIASAMGGTRQRENINALFENWDKVKKYINIAENAQGTASEKMEAYNDSLAASAQRVTNAFQEWVLEGSAVGKTIKTINTLLEGLMKNLNFFLGTGVIVGLIAALPNLYGFLGKQGVATEYYHSKGLGGIFGGWGAKWKDRLARQDLYIEDYKESLGKEPPKSADEVMQEAANTFAEAVQQFKGATSEEGANVDKEGGIVEEEKIAGKKFNAAGDKMNNAANTMNQKSSGNPEDGEGKPTYGKTALQGALSLASTIGGSMGGMYLGRSLAKKTGTNEGTGSLFGMVGGMALSKIGGAVGTKLLPSVLGKIGIASSWAGPIGSAIGAALVGIPAIYLAIKNKQEQKIKDHIKELSQEIEDGEKKLADIESAAFKKRFKQLEQGVDSLGRNLTLSEEEYAEYRQMVDKLIEINPDAIRTYDKEGNALVERNNLLEKSISLLEEENRLKKMQLYSGKEWETKQDELYKDIYENGQEKLSDTEQMVAQTREGEVLLVGSYGYYREGNRVQWVSVKGDFDEAYNAEGETIYKQGDKAHYQYKGLKEVEKEDKLDGTTIYRRGSVYYKKVGENDEGNSLFAVVKREESGKKVSYEFIGSDDFDFLSASAKQKQNEAKQAAAQKIFQKTMADRATAMAGFEDLNEEQQNMVAFLTSGMYLHKGKDYKKEINQYETRLSNLIEALNSGIGIEGVNIPVTIDTDSLEKELKDKLGGKTNFSLSDIINLSGALSAEEVEKLRYEMIQSILKNSKDIEDSQEVLDILVTANLIPVDENGDPLFNVKKDENGDWKLRDSNGNEVKEGVSSESEYRVEKSLEEQGLTSEKIQGMKKELTEEQMEWVSENVWAARTNDNAKIIDLFNTYSEKVKDPTTAYGTAKTKEVTDNLKSVGEAMKQFREDGFTSAESLAKLQEANEKLGVSTKDLNEAFMGANGTFELTNENVAKYVKKVIEAQAANKALTLPQILAKDAEFRGMGITGYKEAALREATAGLFDQDGKIRINLTDTEKEIKDAAEKAGILTEVTGNIDQAITTLQTLGGKNAVANYFTQAANEGKSVLAIIKEILGMFGIAGFGGTVDPFMQDTLEYFNNNITPDTNRFVKDHMLKKKYEDYLKQHEEQRGNGINTFEWFKTALEYGQKAQNGAFDFLKDKNSIGVDVNGLIMNSDEKEDKRRAIAKKEKEISRKEEDLEKKIKEDRLKAFQDEIKLIDELIKANEALNSVYEAQESLLSSRDNQGKMNLLAEKQQLTQENLESYKQQWDEIMAYEPETPEGMQWKAETLESLQSSMINAQKDIASANKEMENLRWQMVKTATDNDLNYLDRELSIIDRRLKNLASDDLWIDFDDIFGIMTLPNMNDINTKSPDYGLDLSEEKKNINTVKNLKIEAAKAVAAEEARLRKREIEDYKEDLDDMRRELDKLNRDFYGRNGSGEPKEKEPTSASGKSKYDYPIGPSPSTTEESVGAVKFLEKIIQKLIGTSASTRSIEFGYSNTLQGRKRYGSGEGSGIFKRGEPTGEGPVGKTDGYSGRIQQNSKETISILEKARNRIKEIMGDTSKEITVSCEKTTTKVKTETQDTQKEVTKQFSTTEMSANKTSRGIYSFISANFTKANKEGTTQTKELAINFDKNMTNMSTSTDKNSQKTSKSIETGLYGDKIKTATKGLKDDLKDVKDKFEEIDKKAKLSDTIKSFVDKLTGETSFLKTLGDKIFSMLGISIGGGEGGGIFADLSGYTPSAGTVSASGYLWPSNTTTITSPYGNRFHPIQKVNRFHSGVDIGAPYGSSIFADKDGTVVLAGWHGGYGNCIIIDHGDGTRSLFGHLSSIGVKQGQTVKQRNVIGLVGSTGNSTGPHIHYEIQQGENTTNPLNYYHYNGTPDSAIRAKDKMLIGETYEDEIIGYKDGRTEVVNKPTVKDRKDVDYVIGVKDTKKISYAGGTVSPEEIADYIHKTYPEITPQGIAAILANIQYESSFNPKASTTEQYGGGRSDLVTRRGFFQLDDERMSDWSYIVNNLDWTAQIDRMLWEGREKNSGMGNDSRYNIWNMLTNSSLSASEAAAQFDKLYERSSGSTRSGRSSTAEKFYNEITSSFDTANSTLSELDKTLNARTDKDEHGKAYYVQKYLNSQGANLALDNIIGNETIRNWGIVMGGALEDWNLEKVFQELLDKGSIELEGDDFNLSTEKTSISSDSVDIDGRTSFEKWLANNFPENLKEKHFVKGEYQEYSMDDIRNILLGSVSKTSANNLSQVDKYKNQFEYSIAANAKALENNRELIRQVAEKLRGVTDPDILYEGFEYIKTLSDGVTSKQDAINNAISSYAEDVLKLIDHKTDDITSAVNNSSYNVNRLTAEISRSALPYGKTGLLSLKRYEYGAQSISQRELLATRKIEKNDAIAQLSKDFNDLGTSIISLEDGTEFTYKTLLDNIDKTGHINQDFLDGLKNSLNANEAISIEQQGELLAHYTIVAGLIGKEVEALENYETSIQSFIDTTNEIYENIKEINTTTKEWNVTRKLEANTFEQLLIDTLGSFADTAVGKLNASVFKEKSLAEQQDITVEGMREDDLFRKNLQMTLEKYGITESSILREGQVNLWSLLSKEGYVNTDAVEEFFNLKGDKFSQETQNEIVKNLESQAQYLKDYRAGQNSLIEIYQKRVTENQNQLKLAAEMMNVEIKIDEVKLSILQGFNDWTNKFTSYRNDVKKELRSSKQLSQYLDADTRKLVFNEADYAFLLKGIDDLEAKTASLYEEYTKEIEALTEETLWMEPFITEHYKERVELTQKEYDILNAKVELEKKQLKLNNVLAEKNVRMLINGEWRYVANAQDVNAAQQEYDDAVAAKEMADKEAKDARQELARSDALRDKQMAQKELEERANNSEKLGEELSKSISKELGNYREWNGMRNNISKTMKSVSEISSAMASGAWFDKNTTFKPETNSLNPKTEETPKEGIPSDNLAGKLKEIQSLKPYSKEWNDRVDEYKKIYEGLLGEGELYEKHKHNKEAIREDLASQGFYEWLDGDNIKDYWGEMIDAENGAIIDSLEKSRTNKIKALESFGVITKGKADDLLNTKLWRITDIIPGFTRQNISLDKLMSTDWQKKINNSAEGSDKQIDYINNRIIKQFLSGLSIEEVMASNSISPNDYSGMMQIQGAVLDFLRDTDWEGAKKSMQDSLAQTEDNQEKDKQLEKTTSDLEDTTEDYKETLSLTDDQTQALCEQFGITGEQLNELVDILNVGGDGAEDAMVSLAVSFGILENAAQDLANTLRGKSSNSRGTLYNGKYYETSKTADGRDRVTATTASSGPKPSGNPIQLASGTSLFEGGLLNHSEMGSELLIPASGYIDAMQYGSTVVPAQMSKNIMKWGTIDPSSMKTPEISSNLIDKSLTQSIQIDTIQLTEVKKFDDFLPAMNTFLKRTIPVTKER